MEISKTHTIKSEQPMNTFQKYMFTAFIILGAIVIIIGGSYLYTTITRPKADYTNFMLAMKSYLDQNKDISDIVVQDNDMFKVVVNDTWYVSSKKAKIEFCNNIHDTIFLYAHEYKLIYKDSDNVYLNFYDSSGNKVAKQDMNSFEILQ